MARSLCFLFLALAISACDSVLEIDLPEQEPRLVIESLFAADSLITLQVRKSVPVLTADGIPIESVASATVQIYENGELAGTALYIANRLRFISDVRARAGRTYRIRVEAPGFASVEAEDTVPMPVPFEVDLERGPQPDNPDTNRRDAVTVRFADAPGDTYYALYGLLETRFSSTQASQLGRLGFRSTDPLLTDGDLTALLSDFEDPSYIRAVFQSRPFEGETVALRITVPRFIDQNDAAEVVERIRLATLSETYYRYLRAIDATTEGTPFSNPQAVPSNVEGGYGIFAAFAASEQVLPQ